MRRAGKQYFALPQRFGHQAKGIVFEVAKPAVDQLAARRGRGAAQIAHLAQQHGQAATGGIAGDRYAVDSAADDKKIVGRALHRFVSKGFPLPTGKRLLL